MHCSIDIFIHRLVLSTCLLIGAQLIAAPTGPTIRLDYGQGLAQTTPLTGFMYFVPLIAPEPVTVITNTDNCQSVRVLSFRRQANGNTFKVLCEFDIVGSGTLQNIFDHTGLIQCQIKKLQDGWRLAQQLSAINVEGGGHGAVEISGVLTNQSPVVNEVRLRFNLRGQTSPVTALIKDIVWRNGAAATDNELVARINALTFRRTQGRPKMEVTLASIRRKEAGKCAWQNFLSSLKGSVANLFIPPLHIEPEGHQAMLDFGQAVIEQKTEFTFPFASRLKQPTSRL